MIFGLNVWSFGQDSQKLFPATALCSFGEIVGGGQGGQFLRNGERDKLIERYALLVRQGFHLLV